MNGGKLAEILVAEDTEEINSFLRNKNPNSFYWIGLTDENTEGEFVWTSNGSIAEYTNWESGEPNGEMMEDCVNLNHEEQGRKWSDISCEESDLIALCERG